MALPTPNIPRRGNASQGAIGSEAVQECRVEESPKSIGRDLQAGSYGSEKLPINAVQLGLAPPFLGHERAVTVRDQHQCTLQQSCDPWLCWQLHAHTKGQLRLEVYVKKHISIDSRPPRRGVSQCWNFLPSEGDADGAGADGESAVAGSEG